MITLYTISAGMVAIAFAISLVARNTPSLQRSSDERGITLQTLIVTTVLVLMAVAAGVVIMAITNSANDRLRGQQTDQDSACEPWEVHDIGLESAGRGGGQGGLDSSAIGCRRVCYIRYTAQTGHTTPTNASAFQDKGAAGSGNALTLQARGSSGRATNTAELIFNRNDIRDDSLSTGPVPVTDVTYPVNGERSFNGTGNTVYDDDTNATKITSITVNSIVVPNGSMDNFSIAVHASGNYCILEDSTQTTANQRQVIRSNS